MNASSGSFRTGINVVEECQELIEVLLRDRVVLVVMADRASNGEPHERRSDGCHAIDNVTRNTFLGDRRSLVNHKVQAMEA